MFPYIVILPKIYQLTEGEVIWQGFELKKNYTNNDIGPAHYEESNNVQYFYIFKQSDST